MSSATMMDDARPWDSASLPQLHEHLQLAIDLELWTIPYYAVALTSIRDPDSYEAALLRAVVRQELVHVNVLANVANAFGYAPKIRGGRYGGPTLPHLRFDLDVPNPTSLFAPHTTALGPLDRPRLNTMCLIEYPAWPTGHRSQRQLDLADYTSVADLHDSLATGFRELREHIRGELRQVGDESLRIHKDRAGGYEQIVRLFELVREQGEGAAVGEGTPAGAPVDAHDPEPGTHHFAKFNELRDGPLPDTWTAEAEGPELAQVVERSFAGWERRFAGDASDAEELAAGIERIIAAAAEFWRAGVAPRW